jgi:LacI family transcriptional regulator
MTQATVEALRREIEAGRISRGKALPSERDLANRLGVSRKIVRDAVGMLADLGLIYRQANCRPVVSANGTKEAVLDTKKDHIAVWLWPYMNDFTSSSIFRGIQRAVHGSPLRIVVGSGSQGGWNEVIAAEREFLHEIADDESCAGAILWYLGSDTNRVELEHARRRGVPLVFLDRRPPAGMDGDYVGTENSLGARRAVEHLIALGHRNIALIRNIDWASTVQERADGYVRAMQRAELPIRNEWIVRMAPEAGETERQALERSLAALLDLSEPPTALFCINDQLALMAIDLLESKGVRVPDDLSVVGFDGLLRWLPGGGRLTSAYQDFSLIGELAAELLLERIRCGEPTSFRHVLLDAPLKTQSSTDKPRATSLAGLRTTTSVEFVS